MTATDATEDLSDEALSTYEKALEAWLDAHPALVPSRYVRLEAMQAVIDRLAQRLSHLQGGDWVLVPRKLTAAMWSAANSSGGFTTIDYTNKLWNAILDAARPSPLSGWRPEIKGVEPPPNPSENTVLSQLLALSKKATPGPWHEDSAERKYEVDGAWIKTPDGTSVAVVWGMVGREGIASPVGMPARANAALMVAAVNYVRSLEERTRDGSSPKTITDV